MIAVKDEHRIYIVITQTGTILSRILKILTGAEYNHVSVSLDPSLGKMYSFGRLHPYNPFWGGFVMESRHRGTFKRFHKTKAVVLSVDAAEGTYEKLERFLELMYQRRKRYHYNYLGLILAAFGLRYKSRNCYYCSEFVRDVLVRFELARRDGFSRIVKPIHFLSLPEASEVYRGKLATYGIGEM